MGRVVRWMEGEGVGAWGVGVGGCILGRRGGNIGGRGRRRAWMLCGGAGCEITSHACLILWPSPSPTLPRDRRDVDTFWFASFWQPIFDTTITQPQTCFRSCHRGKQIQDSLTKHSSAQPSPAQPPRNLILNKSTVPRSHHSPLSHPI